MSALGYLSRLGAALALLEKGFGPEPVILGTHEYEAIRYAALRHGERMILLQPDLPEQLHGSHVGQGWVYAARGVSEVSSSRRPLVVMDQSTKNIAVAQLAKGWSKHSMAARR